MRAGPPTRKNACLLAPCQTPILCFVPKINIQIFVAVENAMFASKQQQRMAGNAAPSRFNFWPSDDDEGSLLVTFIGPGCNFTSISGWSSSVDLGYRLLLEPQLAHHCFRCAVIAIPL